MRPQRITVPEFTGFKAAGRKISMVTAYDYAMARLVDSAGVEGILVSPGNVGELASAILELYRHPETVERMGAAARRRVVENFTWDHFRERLLGAYKIAMGMRR